MNLTNCHAAYFAHKLTNRCASGTDEPLAGALMADEFGLVVDEEPQ